MTMLDKFLKRRSSLIAFSMLLLLVLAPFIYLEMTREPLNVEELNATLSEAFPGAPDGLMIPPQPQVPLLVDAAFDRDRRLFLTPEALWGQKDGAFVVLHEVQGAFGGLQELEMVGKWAVIRAARYPEGMSFVDFAEDSNSERKRSEELLWFDLAANRLEAITELPLEAGYHYSRIFPAEDAKGVRLLAMDPDGVYLLSADPRDGLAQERIQLFESHPNAHVYDSERESLYFSFVEAGISNLVSYDLQTNEKHPMAKVEGNWLSLGVSAEGLLGISWQTDFPLKELRLEDGEITLLHRFENWRPEKIINVTPKAITLLGRIQAPRVIMEGGDSSGSQVGLVELRLGEQPD